MRSLGERLVGGKRQMAVFQPFREVIIEEKNTLNTSRAESRPEIPKEKPSQWLIKRPPPPIPGSLP